MTDFFVPLSFITSENWMIYGVVIGMIIAAAAFANNIDAIRHRNKQSPPLDEVYAKKKETDKRIDTIKEENRNDMIDMEARFNRSIGGIQTQVSGVETTVQTELRSVNRTLGQIEGWMKTKASES